MFFRLAVSTILQPQPPSDRALSWDIVAPDWKLDSGELLRLTPMIIVFGAILGTIALIHAWRWIQKRRRAPAPVRVFHRISDELGLTWKDQLLLIRIAHQQVLPSPLALLLSPRTLDHHGSSYVESLTDRQRDKAASRVQSIHQRLFGSAPELASSCLGLFGVSAAARESAVTRRRPPMSI
jgi:hypothetical protein